MMHCVPRLPPPPPPTPTPCPVSLQAVCEYLRVAVSMGGGKSAPPAVLDAVRYMISFVRTHQASFADPLPYAIDSAIEACLVAFPGVRSAASHWERVCLLRASVHVCVWPCVTVCDRV